MKQYAERGCAAKNVPGQGQRAFLQLLEHPPEAHGLPDVGPQLGNGHSGLFARVAVAHRHGVVVQGLVVHGDAEGGANQVLPGVAGADGILFLDHDPKFKAQGVNELILDLRYNGGGYTSSSQKLASLMVKGVSGQSNALFYRTEYNNVLTAEINKETNRDQILNTYFSTVANNIGSQISRVYVLTTRRTASASELIINGLRPYMTVNTIGTTSYGKNVGSITISDTRNKENKWGMQPIVSRSFNKNNESDYWTGFVPTVAVNEPYGALVPIGDLRDPLLATAINHMNGLTGGRRAAGPDLSVGSSDDFKPGANSMFSPNPLRR